VDFEIIKNRKKIEEQSTKQSKNGEEEK